MSRIYDVTIEGVGGTDDGKRETLQGHGNTRKTATRHAASRFMERHSCEGWWLVRIQPRPKWVGE